MIDTVMKSLLVLTRLDCAANGVFHAVTLLTASQASLASVTDLRGEQSCADT